MLSNVKNVTNDDRLLAAMKIAERYRFVRLDPLNSPPRCDWNDAFFKSHFIENFQIKRFPDLKESRLFAFGWLKFYLVGDSPACLSDIVIGLLCSMTLSDCTTRIIWDGMVADEKPPLTIPEYCVEPFNTEANKSKSTSLRFDSKIRDNHLQSLNNNNSPNSVQKWADELVNVLAANPTAENIQVQAHAINILGFLAMQMLKLCVKDDSNIMLHILTRVPEYLRKFWACPYWMQKMPLPCDKAIDIMKNEFKRFDSRCTRALTFIVATQSFGDRQDVLEILHAGCLEALSMTGLGCINWLNKACKHLNLSATEIIDYICFKNLMESVESLKSFIEKFQSEDSNEKSWPWARLFVDGAFYYEISTKYNRMATGIFLAITIEGDPENHLWKIPQIQPHLDSDVISRCCSLAKAIIKLVKEKKK